MLQMGTSRRELWSGVLEATGVNCPYFPTLGNEACQTMLVTTEVTYGDLYYVFFSFCPLYPTLPFTSVAKLSNRSSFVLSHFNNRADFTCCFGRTKGSRLSADIYSCKLPQESLCFAVCIGIHRYLQWVKAVNKKIRILVSVMMGLLNSIFYKLILFYYYIYLFLDFWDRISFSPGWPGAHCVSEGGWVWTSSPPVSTSQVQELEEHTTMPAWLIILFLNLLFPRSPSFRQHFAL